MFLYIYFIVGVNLDGGEIGSYPGNVNFDHILEIIYFTRGFFH